jgi:RNA polymerase sigma factor (sigma-70 family)
MNQTHEEELIKSCLSGNSKSQRMLYDKYVKVMFGVCLRYAQTHEEAKDILQEGFIKVFLKMHQFGFIGSFEGWMKRIFINTALLHYRDQKKHMYHADVDTASHTEHQDYTLERMSSNEILDAMQQLAPGYRNILNLYVIEGYSHADIGEMLGISEGTSKSQLSRARTILHNILIKREKQ